MAWVLVLLGLSTVVKSYLIALENHPGMIQPITSSFLFRTTPRVEESKDQT